MEDNSKHRSNILAKSLLRWFQTSALALAAVLALLACAGALYQIASNRRDARRFPQRGKSVLAQSVRLNIDCSGLGSPTVILDSGMGVPAMGWLKVQPEVAKFSRVCSYDRAGYGWSELSQKPQTSRQIAQELKALLDASGEEGPYVIVGHSFGGYNVRVFAGLYPSEIAGMVLVDASHGDEAKRIEAILPQKVREREKKAERRSAVLESVITPLQIHLGIQRLMATFSADETSPLSRDMSQELMYLQQKGNFWTAVRSENEAESKSWDESPRRREFG